MPVEFTTCPVRFVGRDVLDLVDSAFLADYRVSITEQQDMPSPYIDALVNVRGMMDQLRAEVAERATRSTRR